MEEENPNFVSDRNQILEILIRSKQEGRSVGILSEQLGPAMLITCVDDIVLDEFETHIILKPFDYTGYILPCHRLDLRDIAAVCPLNSEFRNPYLDSIDKDKSWFF